VKETGGATFGLQMLEDLFRNRRLSHLSTATGWQHDTMIGVTVGLEASAEDHEDYLKMGQELEDADCD